MTPEEYAQRQRELLDQMAANRARECLAITFDLYAQVRLRINTRGEDYTGQKFSPYSPGYAATRKKRGRQVAFVDFNFTGRLQASIRPSVERVTPVSATILLTASGADNQEKLRKALVTPKGNPRGNILLPSADEINRASLANQQRVQKYII